MEPNIRFIKWLRRASFHRNLLLLLILGLSLKRWLIVGAIGIALVSLGVIFALRISTGPTFISFLEITSLRNESPVLRGAVFIGIGASAAVVSIFGLFRSFQPARPRSRHWNIIDSLYLDKVLGAGPNITVIGGGSGLPSLLRGLKEYTSNITAVVTVADDGGSSGRLREELGMLPPGDIRNCLVALADSEDVMQQLMDYRFESSGQLDGHSFGNILIAALAEIAGGFYRGVEIAGELLAIRGKVIPSTTTSVTLVGNTVTGKTLVGESSVGQSSEKLLSLSLIPDEPPAHPDALLAIENADLIVIGPGSIFTSIVPNLLVNDIAKTLAESEAVKVYVCNVAEEPAQTEGFSVTDHLNVVRNYGGIRVVDAVVANNNFPDIPTPAGLNYISIRDDWPEDVVLIEADVLDEASTARHDPARLASAINNAYRKFRGRRRRMPRLRLSLNLNRDIRSSREKL